MVIKYVYVFKFSSLVREESMYDEKEMEKWKNGTANTNFLDLRSWIYLSHRFSTLAPNMLLRISYGLREKDSLIDDGEKKNISRENIIL